PGLGPRGGRRRGRHGDLPRSLLPRREEPRARHPLELADQPGGRLLLRARLDALLPRRAPLPLPVSRGAGGDPALPAGSARAVIGVLSLAAQRGDARPERPVRRRGSAKPARSSVRSDAPGAPTASARSTRWPAKLE